tara:strand:- start:4201 stop:4578 length:378 start_codon:yes stop_codon:yes gene_type:complete
MGFAPLTAAVHTKTVKNGLFELTRSLRYFSVEQDRWIEVPVGFQTDFASIPRIARVLINRNGKSRAPAVIHDYAYKSHTVSREKADALFLEAMKETKVNVIIRSIMYGAVRAAGWLYYNKNAAIK